ncbi:MAG: IS200/IS605 family accessory protein TnpB-related protein [Candidatus Hodarchaeota archaeon]
MQLTFESAAYLIPDQPGVLRDLMCRYQTTKRIAFNRLREGQSRQIIVDHIRQLGVLSNARYIRSAIDEAQALIQSQLDLVPLYLREAQWRAQEAHQRLITYQQELTRQSKPLTEKQRQKLQELNRRTQKTASQCTYWHTHQQNKTFPPIVFGGKARLRAYQQGKLTKAEWQQCRNNGVYCVGERNKKGNANLRVHYDPTTGHFTVSVLLDRRNRNERLSAPLYVPPQRQPLFRQLAKGKTAYTIRVLFPAQGAYVRVLITVDQPNSTQPNGQGIAGVDFNPVGVAVTLLYPDGNFRTSKWFAEPDLMYARKGKRQWLIGNLMKRLLRWLASYGLNTVAIEDLHFSKQFGACRQFNRVKSNFVYRQLLSALQAQALKRGFAVREVNPAFTSRLGEWKYQQRYGLNGHQAAALVIGRRGLGYGEKLQGHVNHSFMRLVVPPMEGWSGKRITAFARDIAGFTALLGTPSASKSGECPPTTPGRRQDSGRGIVPRKHAPTPGKGALVGSTESPVLTTTT